MSCFGVGSESSVRSGDVARLIDEIIERDGVGEPVEPIEASHAIADLPLSIPERGVGEEEALERLRRVVAVTPTTSGARFANQLFGGRERVATAAEIIASVLNNSMYTYKAAGPQVLVEWAVLERMLDKAGMPGGDGMFTPGGSLSNLAGMIVGRNEVVGDTRERGFDGRGRTVYVSAESHYSLTKNASMIGIGRSGVRPIEVDGRGRMKPEALEAAITRDRAAGEKPMMIVATSGTTVMGAFDPIEPLAELARREGLWLHVDGAFGGTALMHPEHRALMAGIERADSLTWDAHKMMGVPLTCSVVLAREPGIMRGHFDESATYLFQQNFGPEHGWMNPGTRSLQCGRRNDALKVWAQWQALGDEGYARRVTRQVGLARLAADLVRADGRLTLSFDPEWVNVCFEVAGKSTSAICEGLNDTGVLKVGHGIVHGRRVVRLVLVDPSLSEADVERMVRDIADAGERAPAEDNAVG